MDKEMTNEERLLFALTEAVREDRSRAYRKERAFIACQLLKEYLEAIRLVIELKKLEAK